MEASIPSCIELLEEFTTNSNTIRLPYHEESHIAQNNYGSKTPCRSSLETLTESVMEQSQQEAEASQRDFAMVKRRKSNAMRRRSSDVKRDRSDSLKIKQAALEVS